MTPPPIKVKLPPSRRVAEQHPTTSSSSGCPSIEEKKKRETTVFLRTPSKRNTTSSLSSTRRHHHQYRKNVKVPISPPTSPSPARRTTQNRSRQKWTSPTASKSASSGFLPISASPFKKQQPNVSVKKSNETPVVQQESMINKNDPPRFKDPLIGSTLSSSSSSSLSSSSSSSSSCFLTFSQIKRETKSEEVNDESFDSGFREGCDGEDNGQDDSRCDVEWQDSSFFSNSNSTSSSSSLGRMRTCSDSSSIFTFKSTSSSSTFTSSSSSSGSSTSETCTEVDTSPVRSHARDEIFYTPTALRHRHEGYPGHEDSTSDHKTGGDHHAFPEPHSSSSFTFNPLSDTFQTGLNFEDDFPSFKLGTPFFNDGYKTEDLAKDKMNDYIDCRASHQEEGLQLQEGEGQEREEDGEDQEDEDEDDFPLSVLEKNIMGLIDEPIFSSSNLSIFPSPPSPPSSASGKIFSSPLVVESPISSKRDSQQRKDYSKEEEEDRFSPFRHLSPLPLTTQTPIKNALESFEKKLEVSKKASYPFLLSSSSSLSTASSPFFPSTAQRQDEQLFKPKDEEIGSKRERKSASAFSTSSISEVSDFPVCRCGCGEQHQLGISSGTPTFGSGDFSPFLSKSLPLGHHQQRFPSHCDVISSGARTAPIHKSIWSIASPPTSPTKVKVAQASLGHRVAHPISSTSSSFNFDESDHQHMKYSRGSSSSTFPTYTPTAEYFPRSPFAGNYPEATFNDDDSFSSYSSPFGPKPSLKRTVSSCLPLNGEDVHSYSPRSFEQGHNDRLAPSPQHYHHQHTHSYPTYSSAAAGPPRHAHPHFLSHHQTYARQNLNGPSPNNKKGELYKTEVCRSWSEIGNCRYGKKCQFAHGLQELRSMSMSMHHGDGGYGGGDGAGGSPCSPAIMCGSNAGRFGYSSERMHMPNSGSHASLSDPWSSSNTGRPGGMSHTLSPFGRHDYKLHTFEDVRGSRSGMEAVGVGAGGRRRSVSSPSKIRMYSLARQEEEACKMDFSIWNHDAFDSNEPYRSRLDSNDVFLAPSPPPILLQNDLVSRRGSLFAALQAEAANAPAPSFKSQRL